ncbi:Mrp/NBP35 family ATP-binding protein [Pelagibacterium sp. H642]|uniref:Mrp/NBP35 family ATP-binding protein n=1 Tax=Pelagibacterium sp. H642 TaxID=1881069 RepID=UPI00281596CD|nr:Mrp/NBP35 family ATP-binding protein [Pelagibacterium sp. H642]WMT91454.1 Mrp/NBP35 family ATP-binding protein [Pelagibacterium sp. H642]
MDEDVAKKVRAALGTIEVPGGASLAEFPGLSDIIVTKSAIAFAISVAPGMEKAFAPARTAAEEAAKAVAEGRKVMVSLTGDKAPAQAAPQTPGKRPGPPPKTPVPGIRHIIAVGSGKGGVGKSTCAVNIALGLAQQGLKVGILDADLYGPSLPKLLGLEGKPAVRDDGIFKPFEVFGLKAMSIGPMLTGSQAVVWRGPMATSALRQLLRETAWGELDVLVVDMPPGTGDIQISLVQQVELTGAVIVSTPQDLALIDAQKAIDMFRRTNVPVLGIVENMSFFIAPDTGNRYDIFGHGGARAAAGELGIPFLGEIPLVMAIREGADAGRPAVATSPDGPDAQAFLTVARQLIKAVSLRS